MHDERTQAHYENVSAHFARAHQVVPPDVLRYLKVAMALELELYAHVYEHFFVQARACGVDTKKRSG